MDRCVRQIDTGLDLIIAFYWGAERVTQVFIIDRLVGNDRKKNPTTLRSTCQQNSAYDPILKNTAVDSVLLKASFLPWS